MAAAADKVDVGDKVSSNGHSAPPSGIVSDAKAGEVTVVSHRGNEMKKTSEDINPFAQIERQGNDDAKLAAEVTDEQKHAVAPSAPKMDEKGEQNGPVEELEKAQDKDDNKEATKNGNKDEAKAGDKRKVDEAAEEEKPDEKAGDDIEAKKQKTTNGSAGTANGTANETKKGRGRPKSVGNVDKPAVAKKEKKVSTLGKSERKTRSQGTA